MYSKLKVTTFISSGFTKKHCAEKLYLFLYFYLISMFSDTLKFTILRYNEFFVI